MKTLYDAIIVGGGVIGGAIAYSLAKRGRKVLLLEKDRLVSESSRAAAGMLAVQAELDHDGPLFQLARKSRSMFPDLAVELKELCGIDIELINKGMYKVAYTREQENHLKSVIDIHLQAGEQAEWRTCDEIKTMEPELSEAVTGGMYIKKDGHVSAPNLSLAFLKSAAILGADIKEFNEVFSLKTENGRITGVITNEGEFESDHVVIAGGAWSSNLLKSSNIQLQMFPVKGECFSVISPRPLVNGTIFSEGCYLVPKSGGRTIVGATMVPHTFDQKVRVEGISILMEKAKTLVPGIVHAELERVWAGIRPQTQDGLPYIGEVQTIKGLLVATGHFRNGILLAPITGETIADLVDEKPLKVDIKEFLPDRVIERKFTNGVIM